MELFVRNNSNGIKTNYKINGIFLWRVQRCKIQKISLCDINETDEMESPQEAQPAHLYCLKHIYIVLFYIYVVKIKINVVKFRIALY